MKGLADMRNIRIWELALGLGVLCALILGAWAREAQSSLSEKIVRLHVVANSDAEDDQELKQRVRDAVLEAARPLMANAAGADAAALALEAELPYLQQVAQAEAERSGYDYQVAATLAQAYFPTREYDDFSLPAGRYQALRVTIGDGAGKNWWCVVFPPLCDASAPAAAQTSLSTADAALIADKDGVTIKFRCVELWEKFRKITTNR